MKLKQNRKHIPYCLFCNKLTIKNIYNFECPECYSTFCVLNNMSIISLSMSSEKYYVINWIMNNKSIVYILKSDYSPDYSIRFNSVINVTPKNMNEKIKKLLVFS